MGSQAHAARGFFGIKQDAGRWSFTDPTGAPFLSVGVNHAEETNLKYPGNIDVWRERYGSRGSWITEGVTRDLKEWGFNTIGWTAECVAVGEIDVNDWDAHFDAKHSPQWSAQDFSLAGMPYCVALPVAPIEGWNANPQFPDVFSQEWADWCGYVARSIVAEHADSPHLIGYFLADVPAWAGHPSGNYFPGLALGDAEGLAAVAQQYYRTIHDAIRAYDSHHLILGDRYNGNREVPKVVLDAMADYVDVLSIQYFPDASEDGRRRMRDDLAHWNEYTGKPVLIADIGNWCASESNPHRGSDLRDQRHRGEDYVGAFDAVADEPWFVGWHWCAYVENFARGWGLKDPQDRAYDDLVSQVQAFNTALPERWARTHENQREVLQ